MRRFSWQHMFIGLCISGSLSVLSQTFAAAFQLFEQDGASIANYHAGYAALATDASIAFYNPAGMTRIKNQQLALGVVIIPTDFKYRGSVEVQNQGIGIPTQTTTFNNVTAQGGTFNVVPSLNYVAPITENVAFGFSVVVPFGLKTNYGRTTPLQFAATLTSLQVIDYGPSLAVLLNDKLSVGAGFDVQYAKAEFDNVGLLVTTPNSNTAATNKADGTGYGYHLGALYEFNCQARVGLSYHSQVVHHLSGTSTFEGPIAEAINLGTIQSNRATTRITLPPYTALSGYYQFHPQAAIMGTIIYTRWSTVQELSLHNVAGVDVNPITAIAPSTNITVTIPQHYRNTWNASIGADYYPNERFIFRAGIGYDQTPVKNAYRNVPLPDADRFIAALGGHYQITPCVGVDAGWAHLFVGSVKVNPPPQVMGSQIVLTNGAVKGGADVYGMQVTWDIDKVVNV